MTSRYDYWGRECVLGIYTYNLGGVSNEHASTGSPYCVQVITPFYRSELHGMYRIAKVLTQPQTLQAEDANPSKDIMYTSLHYEMGECSLSHRSCSAMKRPYSFSRSSGLMALRFV